MRLPWRGPAMRDEFARAMIALFSERSDLVFITGDVGYMAVEGIAEAYGERFINAGIAEQNMVSLAAGLAREGHLPWVYSIAPFVAFRPYEQIRTDVCLHKLPVKLVGNGGGYGYGIMGATHHALEDVGAMRVLPNMRLYLPLTGGRRARGREHDGAGSAAELLAAEYRRRDPGRGSSVCAVAEDQARRESASSSEWGRSLGNLYEMGDQALLDDLEIWNVGMLPLDEIPADLIASIEEKQRVVIIEEHYRSCGLAEAVSYLLLRQGVCPRSFTSLHAKGYPSGRYGSQRWHQEESELAGRALRSQLERVVRG